MLFKTRLGEILLEKNLKQADLCRKTGISTALMSKYMTGKASPSLDNAQSIANALGITLDYLVGKEQAAPPLPKDKAELLADYDSLNSEGQILIMHLLGSLKLSHSKTRSNTLITSGDNGNNYGVVGGNFSSKVTIR